MLAGLAINQSFNFYAGVWINFIADDGADRAKGIEALGARPLAIFFLQVAGGDVVDAGVAEDERGNPGRRAAGGRFF